MVRESKSADRKGVSSYNENLSKSEEESNVLNSLSDSTQFGQQIMNAMSNQPEHHLFNYGQTQPQLGNFIKPHQDATINRNHWVPDNKARQCWACFKDFSFFNRKHHCRICGNVFCHNCTVVKNMSTELKNVRICTYCEKMMENYNKSLIQKNNLIKPDQKNSPLKVQNSSLDLSRNSNSQLSIDQRSDQEHLTVRKRLSKSHKGREVACFPGTDTPTPRKPPSQKSNLQSSNSFTQQEQDLFTDFKNQTDQAKKDLVKEVKEGEGFSRYLDRIKQEDYNLKMNSGQLDPEDKIIWKRLRDYASSHIKQIVVDLMKQHQIEQEKWGDKLFEFVKNAVDNVKPSSRMLNDSMNFNSFIKIKIINYLDNSRSCYVNGIVLSKNLADKRMAKVIQNPKILLLKDTLGFLRDEGDYMDIANVIDQEGCYINILKQKLRQVNPNLIIVEKDVKFKIIDTLREQGITVITNMSLHKLRRIARYTQTIICPSPNVIDKSFVLGRCKMFRTEKVFPMPSGTIHKLSQSQRDHQAINIVSRERDLMYFEGCNPALGCTILLSGNLAKEMEEIKRVKSSFREMLKLSRNVVLERAFLFQIYSNIPSKQLPDGTMNSNFSESPYLITRNVQNRQTLVFSKVLIKRGIATIDPVVAASQQNLNNTVSLNNIKEQAMKAGINVTGDQEDFQWQIMNMLNSQNQHNVPQTPQLQNFLRRVNENYVKTKIDSMCGCPMKEKMTFYKEGDETLGNFLKKLCRKATTPCEFCKEPLYKHFSQLYHKDGCIEIQLQLNEHKEEHKKKNITPQIKEQAKMTSREILMSGYCNICKTVVIPEVVMSSSLHEYSTARFIEQYFYNGNRLTCRAVSCGHKVLRDITLFFIVNGGFKISFSFHLLDVYNIEMLQPKKEDTSEAVKKVIEEGKKKIEKGITAAKEDIINRISHIKTFIKQEKRKVLTKEMEGTLGSSNIPFLLKMLKSLKHRLLSIQTEKKELVNQVKQQIGDMDSIFMIRFLERKLLVSFMNFSKLLDEIIKVSCLLLVIIRRRVIILTSPNASNGEIFQDQLMTKQEGIPLSKHNSETEKLVNEQRKSFISRKSAPNQAKQSSNVNVTPDVSVNHNYQEANPSIQYQSYQISMPLMDELFQEPQFQQSSAPPQALKGGVTSSKLQSNVAMVNQNLQTCTTLVTIECQRLIDELKKKIQAEQDYFVESEKNFNDVNEMEEIKEEGEPFSMSREGSESLNRRDTINFANSINHTQLDDPTEILRLKEGLVKMSTLNWVSQLQNGYVTLPLGTDSMYVPVNENDPGSIIAFVLASNIYKEALIKQNYMDLGQKIKGLGKHIRQTHTGEKSNIIDSTNVTPMAPKDSTNILAFTQQILQQHEHQSEPVKLLGRNDVFNSELTNHQIETELLSGDKLFFEVKFSTHRKDLKVKMTKNGTSTKLKGTSLTFQTGIAPRKIQGIPDYLANRLKRKQQKEIYDLQLRVLPQKPKEYMESKFFRETLLELDGIVSSLKGYFLCPTSQQLQALNTSRISPGRVGYTQINEEHTEMSDDYDIKSNHLSSNQLSNDGQTMNKETNPVNTRKASLVPTPNTANASQINGLNFNAFNNNLPAAASDQSFCGISPPLKLLSKRPGKAFGQELGIPRVDVVLKIYYAKKFEALRRFYCGSQTSFIQSMLETVEWTTVTGGKTNSKFFRSFDEKYVFKEVKKAEFKMFLEFAPTYFDYLCKSFFHNYPCTLCKILGAFKIKTQHYNPQKIQKKYIYVMENLNFGIRPEDEPFVVRYDLKGSNLNRFVKNYQLGNVVLHDNNFLWETHGKPLPIRYNMNRILQICINNDTLCLSKSNIIDYSLLTIIDVKRKKIRFGIIDYAQQYTLDKIFESKLKNIMSGGEVPTIIDPDKYKIRFKRAMKKYFVGMCIQGEQSLGAKGKQDVHESYKESDSDEDEEHETTTIKNERVDSTHLNNSSLNKTDGGEKEAGAENKDLLILKPNY